MCSELIELLKIYLHSSFASLVSSQRPLPICLGRAFNLTERRLQPFGVFTSRCCSLTRIEWCLLPAFTLLGFNMPQAPSTLPEEATRLPIYCIYSTYLSPHNTVKQHNDPVTLQAVTWRHKLHVNQSRVCLEVVSCTISKMALQPFVNAICLIALCQYTDETC